MIIIAINLTWVAFLALPLGAIILGVTVYFFLKTRESLRETMEANKPRSVLQPYKPVVEKRTNMLGSLEDRLGKLRRKMRAPKEETPPKKTVQANENMVSDLKSTIAQQQKVLTGYLEQVEALEFGGKEELRQQNKMLEKEIAKLHNVIEQKDGEIEDLHQQ